MFDVVVIGGGIIGAPAARKLAERSLSVALVAAPEPRDPSAHHGVFGAHYDASRLTWHRHADPVHERLSALALPEMRALHERHGGVLGDHGFLFASAPGRDEGMLAHLQATDMQVLDPDQVAGRFAHLRFPDDVVAFFDPSAPGLFDPRRLVGLERRLAAEAGATVIPLEAVAIDPDRLVVRLDDGDELAARAVMVAAGAFTNRPGLLPQPVALRLKQESVCLAQLDEEEAARLASLPAMVYQLADSRISDVYAAPPVRYPDGRWYLKWGANTLADRWVESFNDIGDWYREGGDAGAGAIRPSMERHLPGLRAGGWHTSRCVITYTTHGRPYLDALGDGLFVAVGGNGHSAKWSPALGGLAADLVTGEAWPSGIPPALFEARYATGDTGWAIRDLWSDRAGVAE